MLADKTSKLADIEDGLIALEEEHSKQVTALEKRVDSLDEELVSNETKYLSDKSDSQYQFL